MPSPNDRRYAQSHEWHKLNGGVVTLGVSQFAVDELTDVTYVEISAKGRVKAGDTIGQIESVKATSDLYTGVAGTITEVNQAVINDPSIINRDPYDKGWLIKIQVDNPAQLNNLLAADQYDKAHG